jgi:hypothetical protein
MVVTARPRRRRRVLVVPDEQTWTLLGRDPADLGAEVTYAPARAEGLLVADDLPQELAEPLARLRGVVGPGAHDRGAAAEPAPRDAEHEGASEDRGALDSEHDGGHGMNGDHHAMMAITGEPSPDGLVMEPIKLRYGPLATPLPGGLVAEVTLDGDVVAEASVEALLRARRPGGDSPPAPDALAPAAWTEAIDRSLEPTLAPVPLARRWVRIARIETERAISHLAWLRAFMRLLGWIEVVELVTGALVALRAARRDPSDLTGLEAASEATATVARRLSRSRSLRWRTGGLGAITADVARRRGVAGPIARACGIADDARADDPLYGLLGFEPVLRTEGDALGRTLLRVDEAERSVKLAGAAAQRAHRTEPDRIERAGARGERRPLPSTTVVEGPRGPLHARRRSEAWWLESPGAAQARSLAGDLMAGREWAAALVALASLDLSPWRVGS